MMKELRFDDSHMGHELFGKAILRGQFTLVASKKLWPGSYQWCVKIEGKREPIEAFVKEMGKRIAYNVTILGTEPKGE
jgi:hypothetical protein